MPKRTRVGDQWQRCDVCDVLTPLGRLRKNGHLIVCDSPGCVDNLPRDESHALGVAAVMGSPTREGQDRRADLYFGGGSDGNDW